MGSHFLQKSENFIGILYRRRIQWPLLQKEGLISNQQKEYLNNLTSPLFISSRKYMSHPAKLNKKKSKLHISSDNIGLSILIALNFMLDRLRYAVEISFQFTWLTEKGRKSPYQY